MIDYKVSAGLAGFRYEDGFLLTRREYDAALDDLFVGTALTWSELRAHAECARLNQPSERIEPAPTVSRFARLNPLNPNR